MRRSESLRLHVRELNRTPVDRYVAIQRERGRLVSIGDVDVDLEQMVERSFLCDRHRCIQWSPHGNALIDNSCCSRYNVPVTDLDRTKLAEILPKVRKRLAKNHPLRQPDAEPPYELDDDFAFVMRENEKGTCQFVLYEGGQTSCAIHKTCLEEGLDPWHYKPLGCSLWPLALVDYQAGKKERLLLTVYGSATENIFENEGEPSDDESHFACLVDQDERYEPLYKSMEGILVYLLGKEFYKQLDRAAVKHRKRA